MTKRSRHEREQRAATTERTRAIEDAWRRSTPADVTAAFEQAVAAARARGPEPRRPDMAPGTAPRPPRPGREPKPKADADGRGRRSGR